MDRRAFLKSTGVFLAGFTTYTLLSSDSFANVRKNTLSGLESLTLSEKEKPETYLTFDDGPSKHTKNILKVLGKKNKATFFMVGSNFKDTHDSYTAAKVLDSEHLIGAHSYSHRPFSKLTLNEAKQEIEKTHNIIDKIYDEMHIKNPKLFRFPYGDEGGKNKKRIYHFLESEGYKVVGWDVDSDDWKYYDKRFKEPIKQIVEHINKTKESQIVLMHEIPITYSKILPVYLDEFSSRNLA